MNWAKKFWIFNGNFLIPFPSLTFWHFFAGKLLSDVLLTHLYFMRLILVVHQRLFLLHNCRENVGRVDVEHVQLDVVKVLLQLDISNMALTEKLVVGVRRRRRCIAQRSGSKNLFRSQCFFSSFLLHLISTSLLCIAMVAAAAWFAGGCYHLAIAIVTWTERGWGLNICSVM